MHLTMLGTVILICTFTAYTQGTGERGLQLNYNSYICHTTIYQFHGILFA